MSEHRSILSLLTAACEACDCGRVYNRQRWLSDEAAIRRELYAQDGSVEVLKWTEVVRTGRAAIERDARAGGTFAVGHNYRFDIRMNRGCVDAADSANALRDAFDALADHFESEAVRADFAAAGFVLSPLSSTQEGDSMMTDILLNRIVGEITVSSTQ